ncbi:MAG: hypothetical protein JW862_00285 [Anaerolineales bacterium]|nr:hypothetical protein [Anaerolineales bacterium]
MPDQTFEVGDWVVHRSYGIGQILSIESKPIGGEELPCYRVSTQNGTYWALVKSDHNPRIRPLTTRDQVMRALQEFQKTPGELNLHHRAWRDRIKIVSTEGRLLPIACLIRDLTAKSNLKKLNDFESQSLRKLNEQFTREWAISMDLEIQAVRQKFNQLLASIETVEQ